jgi:hypothetical protein
MDTVVVLTSDEDHGTPSYAADVLLVFKQYAPLSTTATNIRPIPLGYMNGFPKDKTNTAINTRRFDMSFVGHIHPSRRNFLSSLEAFLQTTSHSSLVRINGTCGRGLSIGAYADSLYDTKIALAPDGWKSAESFRVFEAMKAGCIVVTSPKPVFWFYEGWPAIELKSWNDMEPLVDRLLKDPDRLSRLQARHIEWWRMHCSEISLARYIANEINSALCVKTKPSKR